MSIEKGSYHLGAFCSRGLYIYHSQFLIPWNSIVHIPVKELILCHGFMLRDPSAMILATIIIVAIIAAITIAIMIAIVIG